MVYMYNWVQAKGGSQKLKDSLNIGCTWWRLISICNRLNGPPLIINAKYPLNSKESILLFLPADPISRWFYLKAIRELTSVNLESR